MGGRCLANKHVRTHGFRPPELGRAYLERVESELEQQFTGSSTGSMQCNLVQGCAGLGSAVGQFDQFGGLLEASAAAVAVDLGDEGGAGDAVA